MIFGDNRQAGFTLIELMVSMLIALVALGAGGTLYLSSSQSNRLLQMQNRLTEDGRFAIQMLQRMAAQAGYRDNPGEARGLGNPHFAATSSSSFTVGFKADGSSMIGCAGALANSGNQSIVISLNGACLQCRSSGSAATCPAPTNNNNTVDWVGPFAANGGMGSEVVDFQVLYGIDEGPNPTLQEVSCGGGVRDCVADRYVASLPSGVSVDQVVALQICLVLRSENTEASLSNKPAVTNCAGALIANSATDQRLYRTFRTTALLRNF
ncbi:PilW family protein [uncultured Azonexus sp.]|uniref:PilW family protein n=1 Tax=uncultured Azonexus sp. TaxID=520307 RepID=UPI0026243E7B|nr:PilW family protein [uncultured Azonexus sp.]